MSLVIDSTVAPTLRLHSSADATTAVEIVVPVHDEERGSRTRSGPCTPTSATTSP